jgi:phage shock protein E
MFFFKSSSAVNENLKSEIEANHGIILDVRTAGERLEGTVKGAIGADWLSGEFQNKSASWDKSAHYYLYCRSGNRSGAATDFLRTRGFKNVTNIGAYHSVANLF